MCCNVLQRGAVCCSVLQCIAVYCRRPWESSDDNDSVLFVWVVHCAAVCCSALSCDAVRCSVSQANLRVLQCVAACCSAMQCVAGDPGTAATTNILYNFCVCCSVV